MVWIVALPCLQHFLLSGTDAAVLCQAIQAACKLYRYLQITNRVLSEMINVRQRSIINMIGIHEKHKITILWAKKKTKLINVVCHLLNDDLQQTVKLNKKKTQL